MKLNDFNDVSAILGEELKLLTYLKKLKNRLYTSYYIKKRNGKREINTYLYKRHLSDLEDDIPQLHGYELAKLSRASEKLEEIHRKIDSRILDEIELPECVNGFKKGESIKKAVQPHVGNDYVACLDIHNFFPSVKSDYVLEGLQSCGIGADAAWLIARLVSYKGHLPQGAVTSPKASNIAFMKVDKQILELAKSKGITYTRYADDLVFSANFELKDFVEEAIQLVTNAGYTINSQKIKFYGPKEPHYILGIIANSKLNMPRDKRRNLEAAIHNYVDKHLVPAGVNEIRYKKTLLGKAAYMLSINPNLGRLQKLVMKLREFDPNGIEFERIYLGD